MGFGVLGMFLWMMLEVYGSHAGPRTSWRRQDLNVTEFWEAGILDYSTMLLSKKRDTLYVGASDAIFELSKKNVSVVHNKVYWPTADNIQRNCRNNGRSIEDCMNYIRVIGEVDDEQLYVCGTHAFKPQCDYLNLTDFSLEGRLMSGIGKTPYSRSHSVASVMVDGLLYVGTYIQDRQFKPMISKTSPSKSIKAVKTLDSSSWLRDPTFVFADIMREGGNTAEDEDDRIYFFFTEESLQYDFFGKVIIPRVARVCKGDLGGNTELWTTFLKAELRCINDDKLRDHYNMMRNVFVLKGADWTDTLIYGVFTPQWGSHDSSAVCVFKMADVEEVFSKGAYMKMKGLLWVRSNEDIPIPRPGACVNNMMRQQGITSSTKIPTATQDFHKIHPLMADPVLPIVRKPSLTSDVAYTQIAVDRVHALDGNVYDVIYTGTDKGVLHKCVVYEGGVHIVDEFQLLKNPEPFRKLLLSSETRFLYAVSHSGVVQSPLAFCSLYLSCYDCVLARDPSCAWNPQSAACVDILDVPSQQHGMLIQNVTGDADKCPSVSGPSLKDYQRVTVKPGSSAELPCPRHSNLAQVMWKFNGLALTMDRHFQLIRGNNLLIDSVAPEDQGHYEFWSVEWAAGKKFSSLLVGYVLALDLSHRVSDEALLPPSSHSPTLLFFFLLFLLLFLVMLAYNCYMQYLPPLCLRIRAVPLGNFKPSQTTQNLPVQCDSGYGVWQRADPVSRLDTTVCPRRIPSMYCESQHIQCQCK